METIKLRLKGIVPLIQHNNQTVNPLNAYAKALKPLTSKRNKTDADVAMLARVEWEAGLYLNEGQVVVPAQNIEKSFIEGARKNKNGKKLEEGMFIEENHSPLSFRHGPIRINGSREIPNPELDKHFNKFLHQAIVHVGRQSVLRSRPIFYDWSLEVNVLYDEMILNKQTLLESAEAAGHQKGVCDGRPRFGRYDVEIIKD